MEARELRIGDWVKALPYWEDDDAVPQSPYELVRVVALDPDMLFSDKKVWFENGDSEDYTDIIGIPLTPEILEKAGFDNTYNSNVWYLNALSYHTKYETCNWKDVSVDPIPQIRYLHQLQNLYFALTGEELNIEL